MTSEDRVASSGVASGMAGGVRVESVLITGGAGFIGRAVAHELMRNGAKVRILDSLVEQVHGDAGWPELPADVDCRLGDVRDADAVRDALVGIDSVVHLAAEVGVGQSMYAIERYTTANDVGTAVLMEQLIAHPVRRIVTASSMSIYGEGLYTGADGAMYESVVRSPDALRRKQWNPVDEAGRSLTPMPTPEGKRPMLASVYAIGKYVQERMTLTVAEAYGIEGVALRLWNVFGPGQALSNPYTGVLAIFASRIANKRPPMVFEDGAQLRDFVHVDDVARAFATALVGENAAGGVFNISSSQPRDVLSVAHDLAEAMGSTIEPDIAQAGRAGDIRHCIADTSNAERMLGFRAREQFSERLVDLAEWVVSQDSDDKVEHATKELRERGLVS